MLPSFRFPIRYKLVALSLIVALTPLTFATVVARRGVQDVEREVIDTGQASQQARVTAMARLLDEELQGLLAEATVTAGLPEVRDYFAGSQDAAARDGVRATLAALAKKDGAHEAVSLISQDGVQVASSAAADEGTSVGSQPSFQQALKGTANISDISLSPGTGKPAFYVSAPVQIAGGQAAGVVRLRLNPSAISRRVAGDAAAYGAGASAMLVDDSGLRLVLSDPAQNQPQHDGGLVLTALAEPSEEARRRWSEEQRFGAAGVDQAVAASADTQLWQAITSGGSAVSVLKRDGAEHQAASAALTVKPWRYVTIAPASTVTATTSSTLDELTRLGITAAAAAVLAALLFSLTMTRPLLRLARAVDAVSMGDTNVTMEARSNDEIGDLAGAFARMVASLRFYTRKSASQSPPSDNPLNLFDRVV
jgi:C4-dicarboxylate-specific signal transduction histidine kinase